MTLYEIEGFLRGKCIPGDLLVGESNAEYIFRKFKERDALAAENSKMLQLLTDISDNHEEFVNDADDYLYASVPLDYVSEINMYVSRDVNAENPFAATDASLADIRAQGIDMFVSALQKHVDEGDFAGDEIAVITGAIDAGGEFAEQLRKGAGNEQ